MTTEMNESKTNRARVQFRIGDTTYQAGSDVVGPHTSQSRHPWCKKGRASIFRSAQMPQDIVPVRLGGGSKLPSFPGSSLTNAPSSVSGAQSSCSEFNASNSTGKGGTFARLRRTSPNLPSAHGSLARTANACGACRTASVIITPPESDTSLSHSHAPNSSSTAFARANNSLTSGAGRANSSITSGVVPHGPLNRCETARAPMEMGQMELKVINTSHDLVPLFSTSWSSPGGSLRHDKGSISPAAVSIEHQGDSLPGPPEGEEDPMFLTDDELPQISLLDLVSDGVEPPPHGPPDPSNYPSARGRMRQFGRSRRGCTEVETTSSGSSEVLAPLSGPPREQTREDDPLHSGTKRCSEGGSGSTAQSLTRLPPNHTKLPSAYLNSLTAEPPRSILQKREKKKPRHHRSRHHHGDGVAPAMPELDETATQWMGWLRSGTDVTQFI